MAYFPGFEPRFYPQTSVGLLVMTLCIVLEVVQKLKTLTSDFAR